MPLDQPTPPGFEKQMSFLQHAEALRWHVMRMFIAVAIGMLGMFIFVQELVEYVILGPMDANFPTHKLLCQINPSMCMQGVQVKLQATNPSEQFTKAILIAIAGGIVIAFPYIIWELWRFVKPGLYIKEIQATKGLIAVVSILFFTGVAFGYFIVTPFTLSFFSTFSLGSQIENIWRIGDVISLVVQITLITGLLFQLPVLAYFLGRLGMISAAFLRKFRKWSVVAILVIAGILTPSPDMMSQVLLAAPMYLLYEISILVVARYEKTKAARELAEQQAQQ